MTNLAVRILCALGRRGEAVPCDGDDIATLFAPHPSRIDEATMSERPFRVLGIQQVAVGGTDKAALRKLWVDVFGLTITGTFRSEKENVDEDIAVVGSGPLKVEVDLMQPIDVEKRPKVHDPPLNHIGLWIDDLKAAVAWMESKGVRFAPGGVRKGAAGFDVCFIHPKGSPEAPIGGEGVLIELVQAPSEVIAAFEMIARAGLSQ
jgi:lactoylglutathione lyase